MEKESSLIHAVLALDAISPSILQRRFHLPYSRAQALLAFLIEEGQIEPYQCYRPKGLQQADIPDRLSARELSTCLKQQREQLEEKWQALQNKPQITEEQP